MSTSSKCVSQPKCFASDVVRVVFPAPMLPAIASCFTFCFALAYGLDFDLGFGVAFAIGVKIKH